MKIIALPISLLFLMYLFAPTSEITMPAQQEDAGEKTKLSIREGERLLQEGDLVLRQGQGPASEFIRFFNDRDKTYSHAGMVVVEQGVPYVYHITTGADNPGGRFRRDMLAGFIAPETCTGFGIYRYNFTEAETTRLRNRLVDWYRSNIRFDSAFSLATDNRMYCSEMVKKALEQSTRKRICIPVKQPSVFEANLIAPHLHKSVPDVQKMKLVAIEQLYLQPGCQLVKRFSF